MSNPDRNPIFLPESEPVRVNCCPACGCKDYNGRMMGGVAEFTCKGCRNKWHGGLPQEPVDPLRPLPPSLHTPSMVLQKRNLDDPTAQEIRLRPDSTQTFRKGAPIPLDEDQ